MAPAGLVSSETSLLGRPDASPHAVSSEHRICCLSVCIFMASFLRTSVILDEGPPHINVTTSLETPSPF